MIFAIKLNVCYILNHAIIRHSECLTVCMRVCEYVCATFRHHSVGREWREKER